MNETKSLPSAVTRDGIVKLLEPHALWLMVGLPGSGKSTLARSLAELGGLAYFNGDAIREELYGNEAIHGNPAEVYGLLSSRLVEALAAGRRAVVDLTNVTRRSRGEFLEYARETGAGSVCILVMDTPLAVTLERNRRRDRVVPEHIIYSMLTALARGGLPGQEEGAVYLVREAGEPGWYRLLSLADLSGEAIPRPLCPDLPVSQLVRGGVLPASAEQMDIIGDVHGCFDELVELIGKLGHKLTFTRAGDGALADISFEGKAGRKLAFVGDFVDRGPASDLVLELVIWLVEKGYALAVSGNHDNKLMRGLKGNPVKRGPNFLATLEQLESRGSEFVERVRVFLASLPLVVESEHLVLVHGAFREGVSHKHRQSLALYGEASGRKDEHGFPERLRLWEDEYAGNRCIVHGHTWTRTPEIRLTGGGGWIVNVDTGCVFGNALTALKFPEMIFRSVKARRTYSEHHAGAE